MDAILLMQVIQVCDFKICPGPVYAVPISITFITLWLPILLQCCIGLCTIDISNHNNYFTAY